MNIRVGIGSDIHKLEANRKLIIGNLEITHNKGCVGHSDGDALIHAICDAILGAANMRDIGFHFPDNAAENKDLDSSIFLKKVVKMLKTDGYEIGNIDTIVTLEKPKLSNYIPIIKSNLAKIIEIEESQISIKAKTSEKLGFIGREEGIKADAIVLIFKSK